MDQARDEVAASNLAAVTRVGPVPIAGESRLSGDSPCALSVCWRSCPVPHNYYYWGGQLPCVHFSRARPPSTTPDSAPPGACLDSGPTVVKATGGSPDKLLRRKRRKQVTGVGQFFFSSSPDPCANGLVSAHVVRLPLSNWWTELVCFDSDRC